MRIYAVLGAAILVFAPLGCKKASPLVGTWSYSETANGLNVQPVATFRDDGTLEAKTVATAPNGKASITSTDKGTWKLDGDRLTLHFTDVNWEFGGIDQARLEKARDRFAQQKQKVVDALNEHPTETIHWNGNDEFSADEDGHTVTYHRQK